MADKKGIQMTQESVNALKNLANSLPEASEMVENAKTNLDASFEEKKELLGPHTNEIQEILDTVSDAQAAGHSGVVKLQAKLVKAAAKLNEILGKGLGVGGTNP